MTRLPTTCECKTFNLKMLNTTIYKIAIINAHSVFYSCQVYFFFFLRKTVTLWLKLVSSTFEKAHILSQWCMVKHLDQVITSFIAKGPCTFINSSTLIATQQVINIQKHASWEASTITHPFCTSATCHSWAAAPTALRSVNSHSPHSSWVKDGMT